MSLSSMTLACLLVAVQAGAADVWHMSQTRFSIPINFTPERRHEIKELLLYASRDHGQTWDLVRRCPPDKESFPFEAKSDGPYWFVVSIIDMQNQQEPRDPKQAPVGQKVYIDTRKPDARILGLERQGDEVVVRYEVREENLDPASLKLEYRAADSVSPHPTPVAITPGPNGQTQARFKPAGGAGLSVRLSVKDQAGNEGTAQQELAPATTTTLAGGFAPPIPPAPFEPAPYVAPPQPIAQPAPLAQTPPPAFVQPSPLPPGPALAHTGLTQVSTGSLPRDRQDSGMPRLEITRQKDYKVEFEVSKFGPSGVDSVDVYMTMDHGRTWDQSKGEHKLDLPVGPGDPVGTNGTLKSFVMIRLPREGLPVGITLIVKSKAGLSKKPPMPGDAPQILVELDNKLPDAELYGPIPLDGQTDKLVMRWKAEDRNLASNPITLEWSANKNNGWEPIGATELPNTGSFNWSVPRNVAPKVYLRLTVRDAAGNTAVAQTPEPITIDLSIPEIQIIRPRQ